MMIKNGIQNSIAFTDKGPRKGWRTPLNIINDSKQRDEEKEGFRGPFASERGDEPRSGIPNGSTYLYTYFGARYMTSLVYVVHLTPAYIGLIHEMAHAADAWYGYTKDPNGVWEVFQPQKGDNAINILNIEKYAVWEENRVRHEMGLPRRLYYYFNVFVKPNAEGKSRSVCTMLRRENDP